MDPYLCGWNNTAIALIHVIETVEEKNPQLNNQKRQQLGMLDIIIILHFYCCDARSLK